VRSVWYELAYVESTQEGVAKGQRVWQLAFGSGFKFNSSVLVANRPVREEHKAWEVRALLLLLLLLEQPNTGTSLHYGFAKLPPAGSMHA
jgi:hypothetical protein